MNKDKLFTEKKKYISEHLSVLSSPSNHHAKKCHTVSLIWTPQKQNVDSSTKKKEIVGTTKFVGTEDDKPPQGWHPL